MAKTQQPELLLQADIMGYPEKHPKGPLGLRGQGFYCEKQSERFKAGRPDLRVAKKVHGQLDVELKVLSAEGFYDIPLGFTKLQWLNLRTMNEHGIPAIGLVFLEKLDVFLISNEMVLQRPLSRPPVTVLKLPKPQIIDGPELMVAARDYLSDIGYRHPQWF